MGSTLPMHATGVGKVLLAHAPEHVRRRLLGSLIRITQQDRVRRDGYATTEEQMTPGACSVAVPVRDRSEVVGAIGLVVRSLRRDRGRLTASLQVAARGLSRQLGVSAR